MEVADEPIATGKSVANDDASHELLRSLTDAERERLTLVQRLLASADQPNYSKRQQAVAQKLGITVRSVRRLVRQLREEGIATVLRRSRSDRGSARISEDWQKFIVQTYREGNRGKGQMSPAQVAVRVKLDN